jgi:hypothetical protein
MPDFSSTTQYSYQSLSEKFGEKRNHPSLDSFYVILPAELLRASGYSTAGHCWLSSPFAPAGSARDEADLAED